MDRIQLVLLTLERIVIVDVAVVVVVVVFVGDVTEASARRRNEGLAAAAWSLLFEFVARAQSVHAPPRADILTYCRNRRQLAINYHSTN